MTNYVLGFAFNSEKDYVVLIQKNHPHWQKGLFNGVGGKIIEGESVLWAMMREFEEETGVVTTRHDWKRVAEMKGNDWVCYVFTISHDAMMEATTKEDEEVTVIPVREVLNGDYPTIENVPFLIELCRSRPLPHTVEITYK